MVMGLMDKPKRDFGKSHVFIDDFILYLAFKLQEPIETVVSWLLYNGFDKKIFYEILAKNHQIIATLQSVYHQRINDCIHLMTINANLALLRSQKSHRY